MLFTAFPFGNQGSLRAGGYAYGAVCARKNRTKLYFVYAGEDGVIAMMDEKEKAFTDIELENLRYEAAQDLRLSALLEVLLSTGCRCPHSTTGRGRKKDYGKIKRYYYQRAV